MLTINYEKTEKKVSGKMRTSTNILIDNKKVGEFYRDNKVHAISIWNTEEKKRKFVGYVFNVEQAKERIEKYWENIRKPECVHEWGEWKLSPVIYLYFRPCINENCGVEQRGPHDDSLWLKNS